MNKISYSMDATIITIYVAALTHIFLSVQGQYVLSTSCSGSVDAGGSCTLTCDTGSAATNIQWLNGTLATTITDSDCMNVGTLPMPDYSASCNSAKTEFNLSFINAVYGRDAVEWACDSAFGGLKSNIIPRSTLVTVPLTTVVITRNPTTITCTTLSNPAAVIKLFKIQSPSDQEVKSESTFTEEYGGRQTTLTYNLNDTSSYYCQGDNTKALINSTVSSPSGCSCLCNCARKTRDVILLVILIIIVVVIIVFLIIFILIVLRVITCAHNDSRTEDETHLNSPPENGRHPSSQPENGRHPNAQRENERRDDKKSVIVCIVILVLFLIYGLICVILTQIEPTIQNEVQVSGQECCCSTCDPNGDKEKKECEAITNTALAFGIILIIVTLILIIVVIILSMKKGYRWMNSFLFICVCGCCSSSPPPSKNDQGKKSPPPPKNGSEKKESVGHGDNPSEKPKTEPESVPLNTTNNPVTQPPKNRANTTTGPANRNQNSSNDTAKTGGKTAKTGGEATKTGGETAGNETRTTRNNSDVSSSNVTVEPTS